MELPEYMSTQLSGVDAIAGGNRIKSNQHVGGLGLYAGIGAAGLAGGAALAVKNDPIYDSRKLAYGKTPKGPGFHKDLLPHIMDPVDHEIYQAAKEQGDHATVRKMEKEAKKAWKGKHYTEQRHTAGAVEGAAKYVHNMEHGLGEFAPTVGARVKSAIRNTVRRL